MDAIKSQLVDMGFSESKISKAIQSCPEAKNLEQVMEWLIAHECDLDGSGASSSSNVKTADSKKDITATATTTTAAAASPSDGSKPEETAAEAAARKKITVEEAQRLIVERAAKRAEEDRKKEIEDEKKRRLDGQKLIQTRAELQDQERIRLAQQIRQEKLEKEMHRKRLLEQIALDRENMKSLTRQVVQSATATKTTSSSPSSSSSSANQPKQASTECRIALRFPDGSTKVQKFSPVEQLAAVRLFVQMEKVPTGQTSSIEFVAPPNRKLTESMMNETLDSLGLCPASRLEVKLGQSTWIDLD